LEREINWVKTRLQIKEDLRFYSKTGTFLETLATVFFSISFQTLASYRLASWCKSTKFFRPAAIFLIYFQQVISSCHIHPMASIGKECTLPHPTGIIIGADVSIGNRVTIYQNVTFGSHGRPGIEKKCPVFEDDVVIFAGAVLAGGVTVE